MAFPVSARSTGTLITATIWNSDIRDNVNALYAGALALSGQAPNDFIYAANTVQQARLAAQAGKVPWFNPSSSAWQMMSPAELGGYNPIVPGQAAWDIFYASSGSAIARLPPSGNLTSLMWDNTVGLVYRRPTQGWHQCFIPASAITPHTSNPCGWHERVTLTHGVYWCLQFNGAVDNWATVNVKFPKGWDEANCQISPVWLSLSGNGGNVNWTIYGNAISNGETGNWAAAAGGSCVQANYGQYLITSAPSMNFGPASVINEDNFMSLFMIRSGSDTFPDPAYLLGLDVVLYRNADNDN